MRAAATAQATGECPRRAAANSSNLLPTGTEPDALAALIEEIEYSSAGRCFSTRRVNIYHP